MKRLLFAILIFTGFGAALAQSDFDSLIIPFLKKHCVACHGPKKQKGKLMLHKMSGKLSASGAQVWEAVLAELEDQNMPPEDEPQPPGADIEKVKRWIQKQLDAASSASIAAHDMIYPENGNHVPHDVLFTPGSQAKPATPARIWRVRPSIYESFVQHASREPFNHPYRREKLYSTPWGLEGEGFKDYAALYWIGEAETELLLANAMRGAQMMSRKRANFRNESRPFQDFLRSRKGGNDAVTAVINAAFEQVLRRAPDADEAKRYAAFLQKNVDELGREKGLQTTLAALLMHPKAVFRFELGTGQPDVGGRVRLAPGELAYAIAFALTDSAPDEELHSAAQNGKLDTATGIREQVLRVLTAQHTGLEESYRSSKIGRRAKAPILRFFQEYFGYGKAGQIFKDESTRRKASIKGSYSPGSLVNDTNLLILHVLKQDRDVLRELLTTDLSFVSTGRGRWNDLADLRKRFAKSGNTDRITPFSDKRNRINQHYNIEPSEWREEMPFPLDKTQRAGVLTQPSWLIAHSTNFENDAIRRGKWIRERLLGGTIPNTPITVDAQLPDDETMTLREKMRVTREAFCWKCHQRMDPLGFAFESYDHFGRYRKTDLGKPVDSSGAVQFSGDPKIEGPVNDAVELMHKLASSRRVQQVFVRHVFRFFLGRNETPADAPTLIAADRAYTESGGSMKELVAAIVASDSFVYRIPAKPDKPTKSP